MGQEKKKKNEDEVRLPEGGLVWHIIEGATRQHELEELKFRIQFRENLLLLLLMRGRLDYISHLVDEDVTMASR